MSIVRTLYTDLFKTKSNVTQNVHGSFFQNVATYVQVTIQFTLWQGLWAPDEHNHSTGVSIFDDQWSNDPENDPVLRTEYQALMRLLTRALTLINLNPI